MPGHRLSAYRQRVRSELRAAIGEDRSPKAVASTFSFGVFVSALPNLGLALVLFAILARFVDSVSKLALVAAVLVMNPPAKWAVYGASFWLGSRLLGPLPDAAARGLSRDVGHEVALRLFVGNVLIAAVIAVVCYAAALRLARRLGDQGVDLVETLPGVQSE